ncbi:MAG: hypothetical protein IKP46_03755 [Bacteroidales bacterium]|nr:hypothetical protein [Bacteroidales bacterium]
MKYYLPLLLLLTASACSTVRQLPSTDSTKVEVRYETKTVHDTAYVELPVIVETVATLDTASLLENKYAKSAASVSGGVLTHSLETKPVREPVAVEKQIVYRDSLVYRDRVQTVTVEVEKKLTAWQTIQMRLGLVAILIIMIVVIYSIFLIINHFKS